MGYIPLNQHLFRIHHSKTLVCLHCNNLLVETVEHFLIRCPHYAAERFMHLTRLLKRKAESIAYLLSAPNALKHLLKFMEATKRLSPPQKPQQSTENMTPTTQRELCTQP
ncbi:hypothetical protein J132_00240 [Termitomyces sp. J132]|nr:hypothetical protein J132_00240 [Termitomyces sp. J132]